MTCSHDIQTCRAVVQRARLGLQADLLLKLGEGVQEHEGEYHVRGNPEKWETTAQTRTRP
jgi:hypothetical protein